MDLYAFLRAIAGLLLLAAPLLIPHPASALKADVEEIRENQQKAGFPTPGWGETNDDNETTAPESRLSRGGRRIIDDTLRRAHAGRSYDMESSFARFLRSEGRNAGPWLNYLARELSRVSGEDSATLQRKLWRQYVRSHGDDLQGQLGLGEAEFAGENYGESIKAYTRAIELGEATPQVYYRRGLAADRAGDFELAHSDAGKVLAMNPEDPAANSLHKLTATRLSRVKVDLKTGRLKPNAPDPKDNPSEDHGNGAVRAAPPNRGAAPDSAAPGEDPLRASAQMTRIAQRHLQMGGAQAAIAAAERATRLNPANAQAFNLLATAHERAGNHKAAVANAAEALRIQPDSVPALNTRAWALNGLKRFSGALGDSNRILSLDRYNAFGHVNKGRALGGLGRRDEMLEALRRSAGLDKRFEDLHRRALQLPLDRDSELLFTGLLGGGPAVKHKTRRATKKRFLVLTGLTLLGGLLMALGLLQLLTPSWHKRVQTTLRGLRRPAGGIPAGGALAAYSIKRVIATGGMGVVYEALDRALDRRVAIKKLRGEIRDDPKERGRFIKEARTVAGLRHPHIVQIHSVIDEGKDLYLVFEYIEGKTLRELLNEKRRLPWKDAVAVLRGICAALDHAHKHKVIHRDLKPSNIMITPEGRALVMDFGVARFAKDALTKAAVTNTVWGTPSYMAPEAEEGEIRRESDLYSLGVLFYEMVTGRLPFSGSPGAMYKKKSEGSYAPPSSLARRAPKNLDRVLDQALEPSPRKRYRDIRAFWKAVKELS